MSSGKISRGRLQSRHMCHSWGCVHSVLSCDRSRIGSFCFRKSRKETLASTPHCVHTCLENSLYFFLGSELKKGVWWAHFTLGIA
jgi:hypothetical protein